MASLQDERGYNQGFKPTRALEVRTDRRVDYIAGKISETAEPEEILEIGCGTGEFASALATKSRANVLALDLSPTFIAEANARFSLPNLKFAVGNFRETEFASQFDAIVGNGILHHLYYGLDRSLSEIFRLLKPGGRAVFLEPNLYNPYCFLIFKVPYFRKRAKLEPAEMAFTGRFIVRALKKAGFDNVDAQYRDFLLPNTPDVLIPTVIGFGNWAERIPGVNRLSQSLFITAAKPNLGKSS